MENFIAPIPTQSINIHLSLLPSPTPHHPILLPHFYDLTGGPTDKDDLKVFIKLLLDSKDSDNLGDFPIHGVILVFDCGRKTSLENLQPWLKWCDKSVRDLIEENSQNKKFGIEDWGNTPVFIIGNKVDLVQQETVKMKDLLNGNTKFHQNMERVVNRTTHFLRRKFAFVDFENLLFLSKFSDRGAFKGIDQWIYSIYYNKAGLQGSQESIELDGYTINRCIGWNNGGLKSNLRNGILGFFSRLINRGESESLPLYAANRVKSNN